MKNVKQRTFAKPLKRDLEIVSNAACQIVPNEKLRVWFNSYTKNHMDRLAIDLAMARDFSRPEDIILDVGSSPPTLVIALNEVRRNCLGVDIAPERFVRIDKTLLPIRKVDIEREVWPFEDATFDVIIFNELFEHLRIDPIFVFCELSRVLKPDGLLLLSTPNMRSIDGITSLVWHGHSAFLEKSIYSQFEKVSKIGHMGHVREYTLNDVRDFLSNFDLYIVEVIWRRQSRIRVYRIINRFWPSTRPFFSAVARKRKVCNERRPRFASTTS